MGPWETGPEGRINPIVFNAEDEWVQQTGHVDLVEGEGEQWWAVMLGFRNPSDPGTRTGGRRWSVLGRETFLCKVEWEEGWPVLNGREKIGLRGVGVEGMTVSGSRCEWKDEFDSGGPRFRLHLRGGSTKQLNADPETHRQTTIELVHRPNAYQPIPLPLALLRPDHPPIPLLHNRR
jgi:hypothetical protein